MSRSHTDLPVTTSSEIEKYNLQQNQFAKRWPEVAIWLKAHKYDRVYIEYSGSCDSGQLDNLVLRGEGSDDTWIDAGDAKLPTEFKDTLEEYMWQRIGTNHGGFYNNEGGSGNMTFDLTTGEFDWNHSNNVMTTEDFNYKGWDEEEET